MRSFKEYGLLLFRWSWFVTATYFMATGAPQIGALFFGVAYLHRIAEAIEALS